MTRRVRYGVQVEFTVDDVLAGGPSKADIRREIRRAVERLGEEAVMPPARFRSLSDVGIKYLHEASSTGGTKK